MGCKRFEGGYLCPDCRAATFAVRRSRVNGRTLWTLGEYHGLLKECVVTIKARGHKALAEELAEAAGEAFTAVHRELPVSAVLAVPASQQGQRFRGFSLPRMLEESLRKRTGWPTLAPELRRTYRSVAKSSQGMGREERFRRQSELQDEPASSHGSGTLLLVDDVVTTGATLSRCIAQAQRQGFKEIICAALAEHRPAE